MVYDNGVAFNPARKVKKPGALHRWLRSRFMLPGRSFSYALDINMVFLSGVLCRIPLVAMCGKTRFTWARLKHVDQGHTKRGVSVPLRFEGSLATWAYDNLDQDDHVAVVGRLWMGRSKKGGKVIPFPWIQVERATVGMPVQLDSDPDYIRVRVDLFNKLCVDAGGKNLDMVAPERKRRTVKYDDVDPYHLDDEVESQPAEDPTDD